MARFVVRYRGTGAKPERDVARIRGVPGTTIVDESPRMVLVEGPEAELSAVVASLEGWLLVPERVIPMPDPRPGIKPRD